MADSAAELTRRLIGLVQRLSVAAGAASAAEWPTLELTVPQLRALILLRHRGGPCRMSELADLFGIGLPATTSLVGRLEGKGLVIRRPDGGDRRVVCCHLTGEGAALIDRFWAVKRVEIEAAAARLSGDELGRVVEALALLTEAVERGRSPLGDEQRAGGLAAGAG